MSNIYRLLFILIIYLESMNVAKGRLCDVVIKRKMLILIVLSPNAFLISFVKIFVK